jgi:hypothetical protein
MKTICLLILISFLVLTNSRIASCENKSDDIEYRLLKLHYDNSIGEKGVTIFEHNEDGIIHKASWKLLDGSSSSVNYYEYNICGNLVTKYRKFSDGITFENIYVYDDNFNLIMETFKRSDGVKGTVIYKYDENDKLLNANCDGLNGWFYGVITYSYNDDGLKTNADFTQKSGKAGTISYSYDENGNLIKEYWNFNGKWNQTFLFEYEKLNNSKE